MPGRGGSSDPPLLAQASKDACAVHLCAVASGDAAGNVCLDEAMNNPFIPFIQIGSFDNQRV